ncbi:MAG: AraC family transcriptional regulator [Victivallaceae bacterium]|nr:AraC family transcriptional regulator [Victivallaceae bacterium]
MVLVKKGSHFYPFRKDFPVQVFEEQQIGTVLHGHAFTEVVFVIHGSGQHLTLHGSYPIQCGDILVIPQGGVHGYALPQELTLINLIFDSSRLPLALMELYSDRVYKQIFARHWDATHNLQQYPSLHTGQEQMKEILGMLRPMMQNISEENCNHCYCMGMLMALLSRLCQWWTVIPQKNPNQGLELPRLLAYCSKHFAEEIYLDDLARLSAMSGSTLLRHFTEVVGMTPMEYLKKLRLHYASELLGNTQLTLQEIAERSGFRDMSYFFRAFRKEYAMSPLQYRNGPEKRPSEQPVPPGRFRQRRSVEQTGGLVTGDGVLYDRRRSDVRQ